MITPMKMHPRRRALAALASAVLVSGAILTTAPGPAAADSSGQVQITVVDAAGSPLKADVKLLPTTWAGGPGGFGATMASSVIRSVPAGRYGVVAAAPWGGVFCAGIEPCASAAFFGSTPGPTVAGIIDVTSGGTASMRLQAPAPATVSGGDHIGDMLTVTLSSGMQALGGLSGPNSLRTEWLRDGVLIPGATSQTYPLTTDDVGHTVAPRLSYDPLLVDQFWSLFQADSAPITLAGRTVAKSGTQTKVEVFRKAIVAGKSTGLRADVTSGAQPAQGDVRVSIGKWTVTKTLLNGSIRVPLPKKLKPGKYKVVAQYLGSATLEASQGTDQLKVKKAPKKKK